MKTRKKWIIIFVGIIIGYVTFVLQGSLLYELLGSLEEVALGKGWK